MKVEIDLRKLLRSAKSDEEGNKAMRQGNWKNRPVTISMSEEMKKLVRKRMIGPCTESVVGISNEIKIVPVHSRVNHSAD